MKTKASRGNKKLSLHENCGVLELRADCDHDARFLATLWKAMVLDGEAGLAACKEIAETFAPASPAPADPGQGKAS
jgi:hypothetical protein